MTYDQLLQRVFSAALEPVDGEGVGTAVEHLASRRARCEDDLEASILSCAGLNRPWLVHAVGLQASIRRLLSERPSGLEALAPTSILSFCASEAGGNHPRAIETTITPDGTGGAKLSGVKRWATLAPVADYLVVIASAGRDGDHNELQAVLLPAESPGVYVEDMTIPGARGNTLHLPNGLVQLEEVRLQKERLLTGDGYLDFLKPFRTLEDLIIAASKAAAMIGLALRHEGEESVIERVIGVLGSLHAVAREPHLPSSHLVIGAAEAALDEQLAVLVDSLPEDLASWWRAAADVQVATSAKARRRSTALRHLGSAE